MPLLGVPVISHVMNVVAAAGIAEVILAVNPGEGDVVAAAKSALPGHVKISAIEVGASRGLPEIILAGSHLLGDEPFVFYLADNLFEHEIAGCLRKFESIPGCDCCVAIVESRNPERFGAARLCGDRPSQFEEKPLQTFGMETVAGLYAYSPRVLQATADLLRAATRETSISALHQHFLDSGYCVTSVKSQGWWRDIGSVTDYREANELMLEALGALQNGSPSLSSRTQGQPGIDPTAEVIDSIVTAPCFISEGCRIERSTVGPYVVLGAGSVVVDSSINHTVILPGCRVNAGASVSRSVLGEECELSGPGQFADSRQISVILGDGCVVRLAHEPE